MNLVLLGLPDIKVAEEVFTITGRDPLIEIAKALQDAALSDDYFVQVRGE